MVREGPAQQPPPPQQPYPAEKRARRRDHPEYAAQDAGSLSPASPVPSHWLWCSVLLTDEGEDQCAQENPKNLPHCRNQ